MEEKSFDIDDRFLLMRAVYQQDREALAILYLKFAPHVRSYIAPHFSSVDDIEELVQEVFMQVCQGKGLYESSKGVKPYIFGIARNLIRRHYLRMKTAHRLMPTYSMDEVSLNHRLRECLASDAQIELEHFNIILRAMEIELSPKAREAIRLRFIECLSMKEAAAKAGCSIGAFYARLERAIRSLREICRGEP